MLGKVSGSERGYLPLHLPSPLCHSSHLLQGIELRVELLIIPLYGAELVVGHAGKGIDEMGAQTGVHVLRHEAGRLLSVLGPVGEVADQFCSRSWPGVTKKMNGDQKGLWGRVPSAPEQNPQKARGCEIWPFIC